MKISVITVCKNSESTIERTIESVLMQTYKSTEYIIVDGKSTDKTLPIINKYRDKISSVISEKDSGIWQAINKGIAIATGDIIICLNANDVFYKSNVIEKVEAEFTSSDADLIYGDLIILDPKTGKTNYKKTSYVDRLFLYNNSLPHPSTACRIDLFKRYGFFNEKFRIAGDYDWFLRVILEKKIKIHYLNIPFSIFSLGGISTNKKYEKILKAEVKLITSQYFTLLERILYKNLMLKIMRILHLENILKSRAKLNLI